MIFITSEIAKIEFASIGFACLGCTLWLSYTGIRPSAAAARLKAHTRSGMLIKQKKNIFKAFVGFIACICILYILAVLFQGISWYVICAKSPIMLTVLPWIACLMLVQDNPYECKCIYHLTVVILALSVISFCMFIALLVKKFQLFFV
jgi:hypothetical protein